MGDAIRRVSTVVAAIALALASGGTSTAEGPDYSWPPGGKEYWSGEGNMGFVMVNKTIPFESYISPQTTQGTPPSCATLDDPTCTELAKELGWRVMRAAPVCSEALDWEECIQGLAFVGPEGSRLSAQHLGYADRWTFPADPERGLPTGAAMSLWSDPLSSDPTQGYAVALGGMMVKQPDETYSATDPFRFNSFGAQVFRYRTEPMETHEFTDCVWSGNDTCAVQIDFDDESQIDLRFLMNKEITGWMSGRLFEPAVDITPARGNLNTVAVTAKPVQVAMVAASVPVADATPAMIALQRETFPTYPLDIIWYPNSDSGSYAFARLRTYASAVNNTALKIIPTWSITSIVGTLKKCAHDDKRLVGLVTTNSTAYSSRPPVFKDGVLSYEVASLHREPSGRPFRGSYDLVMRSETARCIYGFDKAPIRGEVQVVSEDGEQQVATTSVSERNGWVHLAAYNFTFSQPTIEARLFPAGKTIQCKLGKKTITVTGLKPKCPPGWKQVRG